MKLKRLLLFVLSLLAVQASANLQLNFPATKLGTGPFNILQNVSSDAIVMIDGVSQDGRLAANVIFQGGSPLTVSLVWAYDPIYEDMINNEGVSVTIRDVKVYLTCPEGSPQLTYARGANNQYTYAIGVPFPTSLPTSMPVFATLTCATPPACGVSTASLDFGTVTPGTLVERTFTITNTGGGTLTGDVTEACDAYTVTNGSYSLGEGLSQTVTVTFQSATSGSFPCTLDTGGNCTDISMTASAQLPPACSVSTASLDFGTTAPNAPVARTFTITNTGGGTLSGTVTEACAAYTVSNGVYSLGAGLSQTVTVTLQSGSAGSFPCTLDTGGDCADISLTGSVVVPPACQVSVASLDFGTTTPGTAVERSFSITNSGGGTLAGEVTESCAAYTVSNGSYSLGAGESQTVTVTLQSASTGSFPCTLDTGGSCADISLTGVVDQDPACEFSVPDLDFGTALPDTPVVRTFAIMNSGGGTLAGSVTESCDTYSVSNGTYSLGAGQSQTVSVTFQSATAGSFPCTLDGGGSCPDLSLAGTVELAPVCQVSVASLDFGTTLPDTPVIRTFSITNVGGGTLAGVVSEDCAGYTVSNGSYSLTAGQSQTVSVTLQSATTGNFLCTLDTGGSCADFNLSGSVDVNPPVCAVDVDSLDFGTVLPDTPVSRTFSITNTGGGILSGTVSESCAAYAVGNASYSLAAGQSQVVTVTFQSATAGSFPCTLDSGGDCADFSLTGAVDLAPACQLSATSIDLGLLLPNEIANGSFTLTNTGGGTLSGTANMDCEGFAFTGPVAFSLTAGQSQTITFDFFSPVSGEYTCRINTTEGCEQVQVLAAVEPAPQCVVGASLLDFGTSLPNTPVTRTFTISNAGGHTLSGAVTEDCATYSVSNGVYSLTAGQSQTVSVTLQSATPGDFPCTLSTGGDCDGITLTGAVDLAPACQLSTTSIDLGLLLPGEIAVGSFTITNSGGGLLAGTATMDCAGFVFTGPVDFALTAGQSQELTFDFLSNTPGVHSCTINASPCASVQVQANVQVAPQCQVSASALDFGTVQPNSLVELTLAITNAGGHTLSGTLAEACPAFQVVGASSYSLTAGQSQDFTLRFQAAAEGEYACLLDTGGECSDVTLSAVVDPLPSCEVSVAALDFGTVLPGVAVTRTFSITNIGGGTLNGAVQEACAAYSVSNGAYSLTEGQSQTVTISFQSAVTGEFVCNLDTGGSCADIAMTGVVDLAPVCQLSVASLDFGTTTPNTPVTRTVTITNGGGGVLEGDVTESCAAYAVSNGVYSLAAGQSHVVTVTFQSADPGSYPCTLDTGGSCADLGMTAAVALAPACDVSVASLDFGTTTPNTPVTRTFSITNTGGGTLSGTVVESCATYSVSNGVYSLTAGQSQTVTVTFQSATAGDFVCTLDTGGSCTDIALTAAVVLAPACDVSVASLDFGTVLPGTGVERSFTITNVGGGTLSGTVSESCDEYTVMNGAYSLTAGQSQVVSVSFQSPSSGRFDCELALGGTCPNLDLSAAAASLQIFTGDESACGVVDVLGHFTDSTIGFVPDWENGQIGLQLGNMGEGTLDISVVITRPNFEFSWGAPISGSTWTSDDANFDISDFYDYDVQMHIEVSDGTNTWNDDGSLCMWELGFVALEQAARPLAYQLHEAAPNPFNPVTRLRLDLPEADRVHVTVCDLQGRQVAVLLDGDLPAGTHDLSWQPAQVASGTYFVVAQGRQGTQVRKVLFLK